MVGRQISKSDQAVNITGPSIALLQERFRRLEKMKEKREEEEENQFIFSSPSPDHHHLPKRQVIMFATETGRNNSSSTMIRDELILPARRTSSSHQHQDPLSLGLNLNTKHADYRSALPHHQPCFNSLWCSEKRGVKRPQTFDISDVDTSLHL